MPFASIGGIRLNYRLIGEHGPVLALNPGGRRSFAEFLGLAEKIGKRGVRVLLHDRRNCGASDIAFDGRDAEDAIWARDLHALLGQLDLGPAFIGGSSSGCRMSILYYLRFPQDVRGLCLFRVTGGAFAARRLPENYYDRFITAAQAGGMAAVCAIDHWQEHFTLRPDDEARLMAMNPSDYVAAMAVWRERFVRGVDLPILGISAEELGSIRVPTIVIPGNDMTHSSAIARRAQALIPGAVLHELPLQDTERDLVPYEEWAEHEDEIAEAFAGFIGDTMKRQS